MRTRALTLGALLCASTLSAQQGVEQPPRQPAAPEDCTIEVTEADSPQEAALAAGPGDVVCLVGTFTVAHAGGPTGRNGVYLIHARDGGTAENPAVLDGSAALVQGDFSTPTNLNIIVGSGWVVRNFTVRTGMILVDAHASDVWILDNDVGEAVVPEGNAGLIRLLGAVTQGPSNVYVRGNRLHDLYGCASSPISGCNGPAVKWNADNDIEHHACFTIQGGGGYVEFVDNVAERCAAILYFKSFDKTTPTIVTGNIFKHARALGRCRGRNMSFSGNGIQAVGGRGQESQRCESRRVSRRSTGR